MKRALLILFAVLVVDYTLMPSEIKSQGASTAEFDIEEKLDEQINLFKEVVQYIRRGNTDALRQYDDDIEDALSFIADWERTRQGIARGIRVRTASDEKVNQLAGEFLETVGDATSARLEVSLSWPFFIEIHREPDRFAEQLEHLITVHQTMFDAANKMYKNRSAVTLPAMAGVYGQTQVELAAGHHCDSEYIIENNGTDRWNELNLWLETISGEVVDHVWTEPGQMVSVSPGKAVKFRLCIDRNHTGEELIILLFESDEINKRETVQIIERD